MGDPKELKVNSLKREFQAPSSDNITMIFDTFNDATNAFVIGSNHIGVQRDMLMFNGGVDIRNSWDMTWDVKWICESKIYDSYYAFSIAFIGPLIAPSYTLLCVALFIVGVFSGLTDIAMNTVVSEIEEKTM